MNSSAVTRLLPTVSRFTARRAAVAQSPIKPQLRQWQPKRHFSARSARMFAPGVHAPHLTELAVSVKKFTPDHEWIELDSDGTTGIAGGSTLEYGLLTPAQVR